MSGSIFRFDLEKGDIHDHDVRYLLMRPDVLMGIAKASGLGSRFIDAMETSAFENAIGSFHSYVARGLIDETNALDQCAIFAGKLGWGSWTPSHAEDGTPAFTVGNSPFAFGFGASEHPVCGPVRGVVRALYEAISGSAVVVEETACAAQGAVCCTFTITSSAGKA